MTAGLAWNLERNSF